jgi:hypothetical protein
MKWHLVILLVTVMANGQKTLPQKKFLQCNDVSRGTALDTVSCMIRDQTNIIYFLSSWPLSEAKER